MMMKFSRETLRIAALSVVMILIIAAATGFKWLRTLWILLALVGLFFLLFSLFAVPIALWKKRRNRKVLPYTERLDIDEVAVTYTSTPTVTSFRWNEVAKIEFYYGPPDFPDPLVGMAPVREWWIICEGRWVHIPDMYGYSARLGEWCEKKLAGFSRVLLERALASKEEKTWLVWERARYDASASDQ